MASPIDRKSDSFFHQPVDTRISSAAAATVALRRSEMSKPAQSMGNIEPSSGARAKISLNGGSVETLKLEKRISDLGNMKIVSSIFSGFFFDVPESASRLATIKHLKGAFKGTSGPEEKK
jgi:hypothetical protein